MASASLIQGRRPAGYAGSVVGFEAQTDVGTGGGPGTSTQILATYAYSNAFDFKLYGVATAYGVIILSILLVFTQFYKYTVKRMGEETWS